LIFPELREDRVPTLVMLGWAAVVRVPEREVAETVPDEVISPELREDRVPTLVMLGWAAVVRVPEREVAETVPEAWASPTTSNCLVGLVVPIPSLETLVSPELLRVTQSN
jgi:hypothetical protein